MHDLAGCIHVHSTASDGDARPAEIVAAARRAGLHYVVLTDHPPLPHDYERLAGWHGEVLVALAPEVKAAGQHCLALGLDGDGVGALRQPETVEAGLERLEAIRRDGGTVVVAHPKTVAKPLFHVGPPSWHDWDADAFDGLEVWSYLHDWIRDLRLRNFRSHVREPHCWIQGPAPEVLRHWDQVGRRRRCVGIGALDNHARRLPLRRWGPNLLEIFPHRDMFRTVRTHLLASQPLTGDTAADLATLHRLLARGRAYVSYDLLADAIGFRFQAHRQGAVAQMGDEVPAGEPVRFHARFPVDAEVQLLRDGEPVAAERGRQLAHTGTEPGVWRVEARLGGRPWIFSNPIYVRERS